MPARLHLSADAPPIDLRTARRCYAEELRFTAPVRANEAIVAAFATVPREAFLAPGPWRLMSPLGRGSFMSPDADARHVYHDVLVAIDEARDLNNGQPSLWAFLYDQLEIRAAAHVVHVGCGTGYYSAILAELVGAAGRVSAYEVDPDLAAAARANLAPWPQAQLFAGDGGAHDPGACDVIVVNAGVTHPAAVWLDALVPGGRLLMPLTGEHGRGAFLKVERDGRWLCRGVRLDDQHLPLRRPPRAGGGARPRRRFPAQRRCAAARRLAAPRRPARSYLLVRRSDLLAVDGAALARISPTE